MTSETILNNLDPREISDLVGRAASKAVENGSLVELLRGPYGHYGSVTNTAADHIEELYSKIKALEAGRPDYLAPEVK